MVPNLNLTPDMLPLRYLGREGAPVAYTVGKRRYEGAAHGRHRFVWAPPADAAVLVQMGVWELMPRPPEPRLSVLLPSLKRPGNLARVLETIRRTATGAVEVVVAADPADLETHHIAKQHGARLQVVFERGAAPAWNSAMATALGNVYVFAADDVLFHPGWYEQTLSALRLYPDGAAVVGYNDLSGQDGRLWSTHFAVTRGFVERVMGGQIAVEHYRSWFHDVELCAKAKDAGCYLHLRDAVVEHLHPSNKKSEIDPTYQAGYRINAQRDEYVFQQRQAAGFPVDYRNYLTGAMPPATARDWAAGFVERGASSPRAANGRHAEPVLETTEARDDAPAQPAPARSRRKAAVRG